MLGRRPRIPRGPAFPGGRILPEHIPAEQALAYGPLPPTGHSCTQDTPEPKNTDLRETDSEDIDSEDDFEGHASLPQRHALLP